MIKLINDDCMNVMKDYEDNHFDLAIVDPPYGANDALNPKSSKNVHIANRKDYKLFKNIAPKDDYFQELKRVSKNQIIWGGNFFGLKGGYICWNKFGTAFGEAELAYCSFIKSVRVFEYRWNGMLQEDMKNKEIRIHPTQKPVKLYEWILKNYAKKGQKILDTHLGSGSIAIACHYFEVDLLGIEIDKEYYEEAKKRIDQLTRQGTLF
tara:strand:+ start:60 stop:683 length:624 start_codon:yes stop_codon:yes gene_type:complete